MTATKTRDFLSPEGLPSQRLGGLLQSKKGKRGAVMQGPRMSSFQEKPETWSFTYILPILKVARSSLSALLLSASLPYWSPTLSSTPASSLPGHPISTSSPFP